MSKKILQNIRELCESMNRHAPMVEERMRDAGFSAEPAVANAVAKFWPALEKLAAE